jgi:ABC-type multidrug transport system ATPase subunit
VFVNGDDYYRNFDAHRAVLGYVPQEEPYPPHAAGRPSAGYAAQLRLPADTAPAEIAQRIARVLEMSR